MLVRMRRPLFHDTADAAKRLQMEEEVRVIEALPAVRELLQLPASSNVKKKGGVPGGEAGVEK